MEFPIINLAHLDDPSSHLSLAQQITNASRTWGFLLLKNHPIPPQDIEQMFRLGHDFFLNIPETEKQPYPINDRHVGYSAALSDRKQDDKATIWLSGETSYLLKEGRKAVPPYWHDKLDEVEAFKHKCHDLLSKLLVCFALAMGLSDQDYFAKAHPREGSSDHFRLLCYPSRDTVPSKTSTRMSAHTDSGSVTLLFQNCAGLEVEAPNGDWVQAPHIENHILVNLGDALAFWSGGQLKATKHRVTFDSVPHGVERMSIAYFGVARPETVLQPLKVECEDGLKKYEGNGLVIPAGITVGEYQDMVLKGIYGDGLQKTGKQVNASAVGVVGG